MNPALIMNQSTRGPYPVSHPDPQFDPADREFVGLFPEMPSEIYRSIPRLSYSGLKQLAISPLHFKYFQDHPQETTPAMELGTQIHCAVLEPAIFAAKYVAMPADIAALNKNTNAYKAWSESVRKDGREVLKDGVLDVANAVRNHPTVARILEGSATEVSAFWKDPETGVELKARADIMHPSGILADLKTTSMPLDRGSFERLVMNNKLHHQSALYLKGFTQAMGLARPLTQFVHVLVETKPPYAVQVYVLDDLALERAWFDIQPLLRQYAECVKTGLWPGPTTEIQPATLPSWAFAYDPETA